MDLKLFRQRLEANVFDKLNSLQKINTINGTNSARIQHIINTAVSCLPPGEAYFEVGCLNGSSLAAAGHNNDDKLKYACDGAVFGEMPRIINEMPNLQFIKHNYFELDLGSFLKHPIGVYYYDADHDYEPTMKALEMIKPYLADKAIIFMDDTHGYSRVYNAWRDFMRKNSDYFTIVHEFWTPDPFVACTKGYVDGWWDGFAIAEYEKEFERHDEDIEGIGIAVWHGIGQYKGRGGTIYPRELKHIHGKEEQR
jgi:protein O-GlcNAc transferase